MSREYRPLMELQVVATVLGKFFVFDSPGGLKASATLIPSDNLTHCRLIIKNTSGEVKNTFYIVGNHYDYNTKFTSKALSWFVSGTMESIEANTLEAGDTVTVECRMPDVLKDYQITQLTMTIWVVMTHSAASAGFMDYQRANGTVRFSGVANS